MSRIFGTLALVSAVTLLMFVSGTSSGNQSARNTLPDVLRLFPGYRVLSLQERDSDTRSYWLQKYPKANSSIVHADFDGDGSPDYALLLKNDTRGITQLVILLCPAVTSCKKVYSLDLSTTAAIVYLRPIPVGSKVAPTGGIDTDKTNAGVKLRATGIELNYFEKAAVVLHWNQQLKRIEQIETED